MISAGVIPASSSNLEEINVDPQINAVIAAKIWYFIYDFLRVQNRSAK